jgi:hypothetical protein
MFTILENDLRKSFDTLENYDSEPPYFQILLHRWLI